MNKLTITASVSMLFLLIGCNDDRSADVSATQTIDIAHCCVKSDVFMWQVAEMIKTKLEGLSQVNSVNLVTANGDQNAQYQQIKSIIEKGSGVIVTSLVIDNTIKKPFQNKIMEEAKNHDAKLVFYTIAPQKNLMSKYDNVYFVGAVPEEAGIFQGEMIVKHWTEHPEWDKNKDGIIQYALLRGPEGNPDADARTKWVQATIKNYPTNNINAELVDLKVGLFLRDRASEITKEWYSANSDIGDKIEVIIANNDDMALGALDVLKEKKIKVPIYGVDAVPAAIEAIKSGEMQGTIKQDGHAQAEAIKTLVINLMNRNSLDRDIGYQMINRRIDIPHQKIDSSNINSL